MSKTLNQLIKEVKAKDYLVTQKRIELNSEKEKVVDLFKEIENKFAPKHLLGQELEIAQRPNWNSDDYQNNIKDEVEQGYVIKDLWNTKNLNQKKLGAKFKVIRIELVREVKEITEGLLIWTVFGVTQKIDGNFGVAESAIKMFDKIELTD